MYNTQKKQLLKTFKKNTLGHNEYYNMQSTFDQLHEQSKQNSNFKHLYSILSSEANILLAYRNVKRNHGSKTPGVNRKTIRYWENQPMEISVSCFRNRLQNYQPQPVKRTFIPKPNGKQRPRGIPCIEDRFIQQCLKQVLDPICEAKFHPHSYGFRPNRGAKHAIAYLTKKINLDGFYHVIDIDIKGFFDNVNHSKLLKQIWAMGIRDKQIISIISKMLKTTVEGEGEQSKGVPQGGILSPLLSNIVLNELDWWIASQWEYFKTKYNYKQNSHQFEHLRKCSKLKEIFIVRYADDFKIICRTKEDAKRTFIAVKSWLKERLELDISEEKSSITDVRKKSTEFLGVRLKAHPKGSRSVVKSKLTQKAFDHCKTVLKEQINHIQKRPIPLGVYVFNRIIVGLHNYYCVATQVSKDFAILSHRLSKCLKKRLKPITTRSGTETKEYSTRYSSYGPKLYVLKNIIYPIRGTTNRPAMLFNQHICDYSEKGRQFKHTKLGYTNKEMLEYLTYHPISSRSVEFNDNRLSLFAAQKGCCYISGAELNETMEIHHITPLESGGTDRYRNLVLLTAEIHALIHAKLPETSIKIPNSVKVGFKSVQEAE